jgi:SAM-dependent methyltransferase
MDLSERSGGDGARHPWETARVEAVADIVAALGLVRPRVLDVGCGDGYAARELQRRLGFSQVVAQDIHLTDALIAELAAPGVRFVRELAGLEYRADLIFLLDVLEHIEDSQRALASIVEQHLAPGGRVVVTVPAFQGLFTEHDRMLRHFRRYSREALVAEVRRAGLTVQDSGYLFMSLLVPRALGALKERLKGPQNKRGENPEGVGNWSAPEALTRLLHRALALDNALCLAAQRRGVTLPGLSVWLVCKAP